MWKKRLRLWQLNTKHKRAAVPSRVGANRRQSSQPEYDTASGDPADSLSRLDILLGLRQSRASSAAPETTVRLERTPSYGLERHGTRARVRTARDFLEQLTCIVPAVLNAPDVFLFCEKSLGALQASLLSSFNARHWRLDAGGWTALNQQTNTALDHANAMVSMFEEARSLRSVASMRRARSLFATGRRYLCSALIYCFPVALRKFLELSRSLCRAGGFEFARVIMWHIAWWAHRSAQAPRELGLLFAAMYHIQEHDQTNFLVQSHKVSYDNLKRLSGTSLNPTVQYWQLRTMKLEMEQEPERLIAALHQQLDAIRASPEHSLRLELNTILEVARARHAKGDLEQAVEIAEGANERICEEGRLSDLYWQYSAFAELAGQARWDMGRRHDAVKGAEQAISVLESQQVSGGPVRVLVHMCQGWHETLRNEHARLAFRQQKDGILSELETGASNLAPDVDKINLDDGDFEQPADMAQTGGGRDGNSAERAAQAPKDEAAWKPGVSSEVRQTLHLPGFEAGRDSAAMVADEAGLGAVADRAHATTT